MLLRDPIHSDPLGTQVGPKRPALHPWVANPRMEAGEVWGMRSELQPWWCDQAIQRLQQVIYMGILYAIIIGLIVGAIAKFLMPGKDPGGWIITILLGLAGSMVAHFIGRGLGWYGDAEPAGFIASVFGAIILLVLYRMVAKKRT